MVWLGDAGLAAFVDVPGLLAEVDQHAAAVRDSLGDPAEGLGPVSLAAYASGVRDAAGVSGWQIPVLDGLDWSSVDWPTLRLLSVCTLARAQGYV